MCLFLLFMNLINLFAFNLFLNFGIFCHRSGSCVNISPSNPYWRPINISSFGWLLSRRGYLWWCKTGLCWLFGLVEVLLRSGFAVACATKMGHFVLILSIYWRFLDWCLFCIYFLYFLKWFVYPNNNLFWKLLGKPLIVFIASGSNKIIPNFISINSSNQIKQKRKSHLIKLHTSLNPLMVCYVRFSNLILRKRVTFLPVDFSFRWQPWRLLTVAWEVPSGLFLKRTPSSVGR